MLRDLKISSLIIWINLKRLEFYLQITHITPSHLAANKKLENISQGDFENKNTEFLLQFFFPSIVSNCM